MRNLDDQVKAMGIAFILLNEDLMVLDISQHAVEMFRLSKGDHIKAGGVKFVNEDYQPVDIVSMLDFVPEEDESRSIEFGISYPEKNVEWVKLCLMPYKEAFIAHATDISELVATRRLNRQLSIQDPHTGLLYREAFLNRVIRDNDYGLVCCIRICNYQRINEIWGTAVANLVFMEILARVTVEVPTAICSKHSTDSFNIFAPNSENLDIERFYSVLNEPFHFNGKHFFSNVALGYYQEKIGDDHEQSLNKAEMAILDVLSDRVRLAEFQEDLAKQIEHQNNLETEFRSAIAQANLTESFHVVFQPVHNSLTTEVTGAECLIRWTLDGNFVSPIEFIPIAEKLGEIALLTQFNITQLKRLIDGLEQEGIETHNLLFALNISVVEILDVEFVDNLHQSILDHGLAPSQIKLELTESALIDNFNYVNQVLEQLQSLGYKVSIDDFGTGFSSLSYLCRLSFDEIKIDRAFVTNVVEDSKLQTVFNSIASLAINMDKPVVAEGVETMEQLVYAKAKQVQYIQGYYFSRPLSQQDFIEYVKQHLPK